MRLASLWQLVRRDLGSTRGALVTSGFGIAAGTAALIFFLALGLGVRAVLLGEVFPIDQVELEPPKGKDPGLLGLLLGGGTPAGVPQASVAALAAVHGTTGVYPKLRFAFPSSARGGKEIFGHEVGTERARRRRHRPGPGARGHVRRSLRGSPRQSRARPAPTTRRAQRRSTASGRAARPRAAAPIRCPRW